MGPIRNDGWLNTALSDHAKEVLLYLEQVNLLSKRIQNLRNLISMVDGRMVSPRSPSVLTGAAVHVSPVQDMRVESSMDRKANLQQKLRSLQELYGHLCAQATEIVRTCADDRYINVLDYHFLQGLSWEETAMTLAYAVRHVYRLRNEALEMIQLPEDAIWVE